MISAVHIILNAFDAELARAFFRDILGLECVDAGEGWLIFGLPPVELACHPGPALPAGQLAGGVELFLMCKDLEATRVVLESKGVEFTGEIADHGYGLVATIMVPGYGALGIYEPRHPTPLAEFS
jgi:catechol 2,3-dioxygenase-like lactoylglutathione lyase family enzyme